MIPPMPSRVSVLALALVLSLSSHPAAASERGVAHASAAERTEDLPSIDRVRVAASERYRAGRIHRFALGGGYRDLWQTPVDLPVLDLGRVGGGLEPIGRFGGLQTAVLGFEGADGRSYTFRGTDKDPSAVLDSMLHDTIVQTIVQDQMAAQHPGAPFVASVLAEAAGVRTVDETMVVMPDDPRLGKYREEFAGMVGTFFEFPQPTEGDRVGFENAGEILDHEELYAALEAGNERQVDVEAFLRARLLDLLLGDFDRHRKQWRWLAIPGEARLQPLPEDRDMAFVRYDGVAQRALKIYIPILQRYDPKYPFIKGLTLHGWEQDRWLLPSLSWQDWERIARDIQVRLTDDVIARAVAALPPEYAELDGQRLRGDIAGRRDNLLEGARRFYEHLAREVDIRTSDAADEIRIHRFRDGTIWLDVISPASANRPERTLLSRRFDPRETRDLRVYLYGGDDRVRVRGTSRGEAGHIRLRLISGGGRKTVDDSEAGGTAIYDARGEADGEVEVTRGLRTWIDRRPYRPPPSDSGFVDVEDVPPRDWGSDTIPIPDFGFQPDLGLFLGAAVAHTRYGFRRHPWSSKHSLGFGWAFEAKAPRLRYQGAFRPENAKWIGEVDLGYSGIEVLRFYGFGNESRDRGNDRFFRVRNELFHVRTNLILPSADDRFRLSVGPSFSVSRTARGGRLIDRLDPYGNNEFGLVGVQATFRFDTRESIDTSLENLELPFHDNPAAGYPTSGILLEVMGRFNPPLVDVDKSYGTIRGVLSGYVSVGPDARATLALRVGGEETFGPPPFFDMATIGGGRLFSGDATNRGFRSRRFYGDSSVFGNVDLRIVLARPKIIVPGDLGVHGYFDVGRVFFHDETSDEWHPSGGGGLWFSPLVRTNTISFSASASPEDTLFYVRIGFHY